MKPPQLDDETVLRLLHLESERAEVAAASSDCGIGLAVTVDAATGKLIAAEEFVWNEGAGWQVQPIGSRTDLVLENGMDLTRASTTAVVAVRDQRFDVRVSRHGWWALVAHVEGIGDEPPFATWLDPS